MPTMMSTLRPILMAGLAILIGLAFMQSISSTTLLSLLTQAIIYAMLALGIGLLLKQNGMVSFGHALYFGASGYSLGILLQAQIMPAELAILATIGAIALGSFLIGLVIVRVPGVAFSMLTLAIGQMFYLTASRARGVTGGADGMNIEWPARLFGLPLSMLLKPANIFIICWVALVLVTLALFLILRSRYGAVTEAVRDNEERARFIGITTLMPRAMVYAGSAVIACMAGILSALNTGFISPESLHWSLSGMALMMVVVGGYTVLWGPPIGAVVYFMFKDVLGDFSSHWMTIFGLALIAVIVFSPTGIAGAALKLLARQKNSNAATAAGHGRKPQNAGSSLK